MAVPGVPDVLTNPAGPAAWCFNLDAIAAAGIVASIATFGAAAIISRRWSHGQWHTGRLCAMALILAVAQATLSLAGNPFTSAVCWQLQWLAVCGLSLISNSDELRHVSTRTLVSGWLFDAPFVVASLLALSHSAWQSITQQDPATARMLTGGMALAIAHRAGLLPTGTISKWNDAPREEFRLFALVAVLPPVIVLVLRLNQLLLADPSRRSSLSELLLFGSVLAMLAAWGQKAALRRSAWTAALFLGAASAVSLTLPLMFAMVLWGAVTIAALAILFVRSSQTEVVSRPSAPTPEAFAGVIRWAGEEWSLPRVWRFAVEMPLRGASHLVRFVDGFAFELLPKRLGQRLLRSPNALLERLPLEVRDKLWPGFIAALLVVFFVQAFQ